jgi:hypothetical protein
MVWRVHIRYASLSIAIPIRDEYSFVGISTIGETITYETIRIADLMIVRIITGTVRGSRGR